MGPVQKFSILKGAGPGLKKNQVCGGRVLKIPLTNCVKTTPLILTSNKLEQGLFVGAGCWWGRLTIYMWDGACSKILYIEGSGGLV